MTCAVRIATASDIPAMHRIRCSVVENPLPAEAGVSEASYRPLVEAGSLWVAERDGGICGFTALDAATANVWALFVAPGAEGLGVGRALHDEMIRWARGHGLMRLWLSTAEGTRAARFYARAGWMRAGTTPQGEIRFERSLSCG